MTESQNANPGGKVSRASRYAEGTGELSEMVFKWHYTLVSFYEERRGYIVLNITRMSALKIAAHIHISH